MAQRLVLRLVETRYCLQPNSRASLPLNGVFSSYLPPPPPNDLRAPAGKSPVCDVPPHMIPRRKFVPYLSICAGAANQEAMLGSNMCVGVRVLSITRTMRHLHRASVFPYPNHK